MYAAESWYPGCRSPQFDQRDAEILKERVAQLNKRSGPRVGDFVRFPDGTVRRFSYIWDFEDGSDISAQTAGGGSFHLGECGVSFSGTLFSGIPGKSLTLTNEKRNGDVWFFHHGFAGADCGVNAVVEFRVFESNTDPPSC
jgi:hypothetical protein